MACDEKLLHEEKLKQHEDYLDDHEDRLRIIEDEFSGWKADLTNLINTVKDLIQEMREEKKERQRAIEEEKKQRLQILMWVAAVGVGFIIWYIQKG